MCNTPVENLSFVCPVSSVKSDHFAFLTTCLENKRRGQERSTSKFKICNVLSQSGPLIAALIADCIADHQQV